ncbi:MAG: hypothetical protein LBG43_08025 [Treponema sp.]|nr:hypothetical protein [Treponema sp.]
MCLLPEKDLAPQLIYKGGILKRWDKKMAVALDIHFLRLCQHYRK